MSYSEADPPPAHAITAAVAALLISDVPFTRAVAGVQVGRVLGDYVINPSEAELADSDLDLLMAGTESAVLMIEGFGDFLSDEEMLEAAAVGQAAITTICKQLQARV